MSMTRRDMVAAGLLFPLTMKGKVVKPKPKDVVVIEVPDLLSNEGRRVFTARMQRYWPDHHVVVLDAGATAKCVGGETV